MDEFERELRDAMERRPAPARLKRKIMAARAEKHRSRRMAWLERVAASMIFAAVVASAAFWHRQEEERRGEEVKQQVFTALRITNHALQQMNTQLAEHDRNKY
jgi:class 3 adenylate cyclase